MDLADLGIDRKTKQHDRTLTHIETRFVGILWTEHAGYENRINAISLARAYYLAINDIDMDAIDDRKRRQRLLFEALRHQPQSLRDVRTLQNHLLIKHENIPILSRAGEGGGYWIAETEEEAEQFYRSFRKRGLTGLIKASRGKKAVLADIVQQLTFEFEELGKGADMNLQAPSAQIEVVDNLLEVMTADPDRFAAELRRLGQKFGSVLLPKKQMAAMQSQVQQLQKMLDGIGGL